MKTIALWGVVLAVAAVLIAPDAAFAQSGLVPCDGTPGNECQSCHVVALINEVVDFLVGILGIIATLLIAVAGIRLVTSAGDTSARESAKRTFSNVIIGYVIVLAGWLLVDTVMKVLLGNQAYGTWNEIQCVAQPRADFMNPTPGQSRGTASGLTEEEYANLSAEELRALTAAGASYDDLVCAAAASAGIAGQCTNLQALMRVESSGCQNLTSPAGAYGCMQILPSTAKQYDPSLRTLSDAEVIAKLRDDHAYNIALGATIYADAYTRYNGQTDLVYAAYNGGFGANEPSRNCTDARRWECTWDGSNCRDGVGTDCRQNTGYQETRNYVQKINTLSSDLGGS